MKKALVVGGSSGIGLALVLSLLKEGYGAVFVADKKPVDMEAVPEALRLTFQKTVVFHQVDLTGRDFRCFDNIKNIDTLLITAGFGRVAALEALSEIEVDKLVRCNMLGVIRVLRKYYHKIHSHEPFTCAVMGSIAGHVASPLFSVYGAAKAGLCSFIENVNVELKYQGYSNRILDVSPGSLKGTNFNGGGNDPRILEELAKQILQMAQAKQTLFIPQYEIYGDVLARYQADPGKFGMESYEYKVKNNRLSDRKQVVIGYLSGTFDLFHIGHLNLLRRAKEQCDYLIVGVHESGAWKGKDTFIPFEERKAIVDSICYVDETITSFTEDSDAYDALHFDKLFVGSDYKGTERFARYEAYFADKGVQIVYFPYTQGTSSTQLREALKQAKK